MPNKGDLFGTWRLDDVIAVGGMGEIWRAQRIDRRSGGDVDGEQVVALKRLHSHLSRNNDARGQFAVEQRLTTELPRHANVVHAVEAASISGRPYIALALAPGEDLRRQLAPTMRAGSDQPTPRAILPRARVRAVMIAACDAAAHLHRHGYVHGDINPSNLVVDDDDHVTLVDLGIAREVGRAGTVRGTHAYMAPEQVRGEPWTAATDVFALGIVLWELAAGARLFHRGPPWLSQAAVVDEPALPLDDPALDEIAQAALVKDPARRITSASELAERLRSV